MTWLLVTAAVTATCILLAECCMRQPPYEHEPSPTSPTTTWAYVEMATEAPQPLPQPTPSPTPPVRAHRVPCIRSEVNRTSCLQGSCTAVIIVAVSRTSFCSCFPGWEGLRCEFKSQYPYIPSDTGHRVEGASVALSILVAMIIIGLVIFACFWYSSNYGVGLNSFRLGGQGQGPAGTNGPQRGQPNGRHIYNDVNVMERDTSGSVLLQTVATVS